jgi:hypothetical protein
VTPDERRDAFALRVLGMAHEDGINGSDVAAGLLAVLGILYANAAAGDVARFGGYVQVAVDALWRTPDAPLRPKAGLCHYCCDCESSACLHSRVRCGRCAAAAQPGEILSDQELAAHGATVRAAIRWTKSPKATVDRSFELIMAELRRLRAAR